MNSKTPIIKPCSCCGQSTQFFSRLNRTCNACKKKNNNEAQKRHQKRHRGEYVSLSKLVGKPFLRATQVEPELATEMCRSALSRFCSVLDIGPSGPVRNIRPGDPEFARLAEMYGSRR